MIYSTIDDLYDEYLRLVSGRKAPRSRDDLLAALQAVEELNWPLEGFQASMVKAAMFNRVDFSDPCWAHDADVSALAFAAAYDDAVGATFATNKFPAYRVTGQNEAQNWLPTDLLVDYNTAITHGEPVTAYRIYIYDADTGEEHPQWAYAVFLTALGLFGVAWGADASWFDSTGDVEQDLRRWRRGTAPAA